MLSITILSAVLVVLITNIKRLKSRKWFTLCLVIVFNLLIIECCVYIYLLVLINRGDGLFLIGNQKFLDWLIKREVVAQTIEGNNDHNRFYVFDDDLGYSVGKNRSYQKYVSNSQGLRSNHDYTLAPKEDTLRMAVFGDSYVFGDGERNEGTWPYFLEKAVGNLEVLNFGVSGYGLGQSVKRYLTQGLAYKPDVIFCNYTKLGPRDVFNPKTISGFKTSSLYRVFYSWENGELKNETMTPFKFFDAAFRQRYIYSPMRLDEDHFLVSSKLLSHTNIGVFVKRYLLLKHFANTEAKIEHMDDQLSARVLESMLKEAVKNGSDIILFTNSPFHDLPIEIKRVVQRYSDHTLYFDSGELYDRYFQKYGYTKESLYNATDHYNPQGNLIIAEALAHILAVRKWGHGSRRFVMDLETHSFKRIADEKD